MYEFENKKLNKKAKLKSNQIAGFERNSNSDNSSGAFPLIDNRPTTLQLKDLTQDNRPVIQLRKRKIPIDNFKRILLDTNVLQEIVEAVYNQIDDAAYGEYQMNGDQSATTNAEGQAYRTTDNMHSEMVALSDLTREDDDGNSSYAVHAEVHKMDGEAFDYETEQPHCGFCTFYLQALGLPLSTPTKGRHQFASHGNYPLPDRVKYNQAFIEALLTKAGNLNLQSLMNLTISNTDEDVEWNEFLEWNGRGYINGFWECLNEAINQHLSD